MGIRIEDQTGQVHEAPEDVSAEGGEALEAWASANVPGYPFPPQVTPDAGRTE